MNFKYIILIIIVLLAIIGCNRQIKPHLNYGCYGFDIKQMSFNKNQTRKIESYITKNFHPAFHIKTLCFKPIIVEKMNNIGLYSFNKNYHLPYIYILRYNKDIVFVDTSSNEKYLTAIETFINEYNNKLHDSTKQKLRNYRPE